MRDSTHHSYVCTECGREIRMAAEIAPDGWDSYKNAGLRFACDCTAREVGNPDDHLNRPHYWVLDTDYEVAEL